MTLLIILAILSVLAFLFLWCAFALGAKADQQSEHIFRKHIDEKKQE